MISQRFWFSKQNKKKFSPLRPISCFKLPRTWDRPSHRSRQWGMLRQPHPPPWVHSAHAWFLRNMRIFLPICNCNSAFQCFEVQTKSYIYIYINVLCTYVNIYIYIYFVSMKKMEVVQPYLFLKIPWVPWIPWQRQCKIGYSFYDGYEWGFHRTYSPHLV